MLWDPGKSLEASSTGQTLPDKHMWTEGDMSREEAGLSAPAHHPPCIHNSEALYIRWGTWHAREENYMDFGVGLRSPFYNLLALIWASVSSSVTYHSTGERIKSKRRCG